MNDAAIIVESVSKKYKLGKRTVHRDFREAISARLSRPFRQKTAHSTAISDEFWALKDVSFQVDPGEVIGVLGRNGAGKSTLLKVLSRITDPTSGRIRLRGRVASLLEVGTGFHPELTGRENIFLNGAILGMKREEIRKRFDQIVAFAEVEKFLDTAVKFYSSGMYVRLAFAVAAHLEPEILIVDEVLAVGDADFQDKCLGKMREVSTGDGRTVIFVSHNMTAIERLCQRGVFLANGAVEFVGSATDAVARYLRREDVGHAVHAAFDVGPFSCTSIELSGINGEIRSTCDMSVKFSLRANEEIVSFGARIFIEALDGTPLADLDPYPSHPRLRVHQEENVLIEVVLRALPLRPGDYRIRFMFKDDGRYLHWELPCVMQFHVEPSLEPKNNNWNQVIHGPLTIQFCQTVVPQV